MALRWNSIKYWIKRRKKSLLLLLSPLVLFIILNILFPIKPLPEYSQVILDNKGSIMKAYLTYDDKWRLYVHEDEISDALESTILFKEDQWFYWHIGINPLSIIRALYNNLVYGKRTSGASTITMQVARMLEPKERTIKSKIIEMFRAFQLEWKYSKKEILRLYLNLAPYGGNIEGIKSASLFYFNKSPDHLSLSEIVSLSIIPNRPESLKPGKDEVELLKARDKWLIRFNEEQLFDSDLIQESLDNGLSFNFGYAANFAPHFCNRMHNIYQGHEINSYIDRSVQRLAEKQITAQLGILKPFNIYNGSVVIIENKTKNVIAYVGSNDFSDNIHQGQVDGVDAIRQPGSTLKPFIYAKAIDMGIITPKRVLLDVPVNFGGYRPENFDRKFHGKITAQEALGQSLNIPAVSLLNSIGLEQLTNMLIKGQCRQIRRDAHKLGLSAALGGCGLRLEELAGMYASLASDGWWAPLQYVDQGKTAKDSTRLYSAEAAYLIFNILKEVQRPDFPAAWNSNIPHIAWKTGTSYGRRDAWCIGYTKKYTVAVWVGNFTGEGQPELTGAYAAAPVVFNIFNSLDKTSGFTDFKVTENIKPRYVCPESGLPPNSLCNEEIIDNYIPLVSDNQSCDVETRIWVSKDTTSTYCLDCMPGNNVTRMVIKSVPTGLAYYMDQNFIPYDKPPPHNPNCTRIGKNVNLRISNPTNSLEYLIDQNNEDMLQLSAEMPQDSELIYWWVDGKYIGQNARGETRFIHPSKGIVTIECTDDKGRKDRVKIEVKYF